MRGGMVKQEPYIKLQRDWFYLEEHKFDMVDFLYSTALNY